MRRDRAVSSSCARRIIERSPARAGLAFVELLVVLALSGLLFGILWALFRNAASSVQAGREGAAMNRLHRLAMLHLREDLENAVAVTHAGPGRLAFRMAGDFAADGRAMHEDVEYLAAGGDLVRRDAAGETRMGGRADGIALAMDARLDWREDGGVSRYEVAFVLTGTDAPGHADSLEIRVAPPMMASRRALLWAPADEGGDE